MQVTYWKFINGCVTLHPASPGSLGHYCVFRFTGRLTLCYQTLWVLLKKGLRGSEARFMSNHDHRSVTWCGNKSCLFNVVFEGNRTGNLECERSTCGSDATARFWEETRWEERVCGNARWSRQSVQDTKEVKTRSGKEALDIFKEGWSGKLALKVWEDFKIC